MQKNQKSNDTFFDFFYQNLFLRKSSNDFLLKLVNMLIPILVKLLLLLKAVYFFLGIFKK